MLYINTNSKGNHEAVTNRYTFSRFSDIDVEKSCFFHVELKFLINNFSFFSVSSWHYNTNTLYVCIIVPWFYEQIFKSN